MLVIVVAFTPTAAEIKSSVGFQIQSPNLVGSSHGENQGVSIDSNNVPGARQLLVLRVFVAFFVIAFHASSNNRQHLPFRQADLSDGVILGVTQI